MANEPEVVSAETFATTADRFGYRYTAVRPACAGPDGDAPPFQGTLGLNALPCGMKLCAIDLKYLQESEHDGELTRSLTIAVALAGETANCDFGDGGRLHLAAGSAAVVSVSDGARLAGRVRAGQTWRGLLLRTQPEILSDSEVAGRVDGLLSSDSIEPLPISPRTGVLINELFQSTGAGVVGRLLAESCALELLARALVAGQANEPALPRSVSAGDQARILLVRDRLLAEPECDHHLSDLARDAGLSVSTLKAKFPLVVGLPVFAFLRDVRLRRAYEGISQDGWTVSQAAYHVGYRHHSNFSTAFRRKFGIAPSALRGR